MLLLNFSIYALVFANSNNIMLVCIPFMRYVKFHWNLSCSQMTNVSHRWHNGNNWKEVAATLAALTAISRLETTTKREWGREGDGGRRKEEGGEKKRKIWWASFESRNGVNVHLTGLLLNRGRTTGGAGAWHAACGHMLWQFWQRQASTRRTAGGDLCAQLQWLP